MIGFLAPLLLSGLGAGMSIYAQNQAAQRQQEAAAQRYRNQLEANKQKNDAIMQGVEQYKPEQRTQAYQQAQTDSTDRLLQLLQSTPSELQGISTATAGNTGQDYDLARAKATATSADRAHQLARLLGRTGGQAELFQRESERMGTAQNNAMMLGNFAQGQDQLDALKTQQAGQVNPWLSMAGSALSSYGANAFKW